MATTPIEFDLSGATGLTLTADVHAPLSDTILASGKSCTEQTNRKGVYRFDMTENVTGVNIVRVKSGTLTIATFTTDSRLADNTTVYEASDKFKDLISIRGVEQSAIDLKDFADDGYDPSTNKVQGVVLVDTTTSLTNAATNGDLTATMKTSIGTAVAASAVASVTGNVGGNVNGNVVGSVASVTAPVTAGTVSDKTGFSLASGGLDLTQLHLDWANGGRLDLIVDAAAADALLARKLIEADKYVVKTGSPWQVVYMLKGSGAPGAGTELLRQDLFDVDGGDVAAVTTVIGQTVVA